MRVRVSPTALRYERRLTQKVSFFSYYIYYPGLVILTSSEAHQAKAVLDAVGGRADEQQPLAKEIWHHYQISLPFDRLDELVPREDEVGEGEKYGAECVQTASLQQCHHQHRADDDGIDLCADADDSFRSIRRDAGQAEDQQGADTEGHHSQKSFCLCCQLSVLLDFSAVSADEEYYHPHMRQRKESHLTKEVAARSHIISRCRAYHSQQHLPRQQP